MPYRLVVLLCSLALAAVFTAAGWYLCWQVEERFEIDLAGDGKRLFSAYTVQNEALVRASQTLAHSIATDAEVKRLLDEGGKAVRAEGGGGSGDLAAQIRQDLQERTKRQWNELRAQHEVEHMNFLLPDGVVFLRMNFPGYFGDSLAPIRPMLAAVILDQKPRGGFEIGHAYAGVRGSVAVMHDTPPQGERPVGVIEIGFDMSAQLNRLDRQLNAGIALLLDNNRVAATMLKSHRPATKTRHSFILAATRREAGDWLEAGLLPTGGHVPQTRRLKWNDRQFQLITFALDDYQSGQASRHKPPGTVLIWHDISERVRHLESERTAAIHATLTAYALTQFFVLALLRLARHEWECRLHRGTASIERLSKHNARLLDAVADGICGVDRDGRITFINRAALTMHGYRIEEVLGQNPHQLFHHHRPDGRPNPSETCPFEQALKDGEARESEEWLFRRDGSCFPVKMTITPIFDQGQKNGAVAVFHDISEQRSRQEALLQLATTDSLTGASNRRHFLDQLDSELARQRRHGGRAALLMADLDYFKRVNDDYGHAAGDAVLSHFVNIAHQTVRRSDIIGRMGGEEFAILLPGDDIHGARELAERLRRSFESKPAKIGNIFIPATVSIGIADLRTDDMTADAPLRRADKALYAAKGSGRNCIALYDPNVQRAPPNKIQNQG